jgi:hypothetical protein
MFYLCGSHFLTKSTDLLYIPKMCVQKSISCVFVVVVFYFTAIIVLLNVRSITLVHTVSQKSTDL